MHALQRTLAQMRRDYAFCRRTPLACMATVAEAFNGFAHGCTVFAGAVEELREVVALWEGLEIPAVEAMDRITRIDL